MSKSTLDYQEFDIDGIGEAPEMIEEARSREGKNKRLREMEARRQEHEKQLEVDYLLSTINQHHVEARAKAEKADNREDLPEEREYSVWQTFRPLAAILVVFLSVVAALLLCC